MLVDLRRSLATPTDGVKGWQGTPLAFELHQGVASTKIQPLK
jgi:hypothetical protein